MKKLKKGTKLRLWDLEKSHEISLALILEHVRLKDQESNIDVNHRSGKSYNFADIVIFMLPSIAISNPSLNGYPSVLYFVPTPTVSLTGFPCDSEKNKI